MVRPDVKTIAEQVRCGAILVSDGAWGTQLQARGLRPGECPELWCADRPADILAVARSYLDAGAVLVKSNSFGGTRFKFDLYGLAARTAELNEKAAALAREAAGPDRHVLGSVGPTGKILLTGEVTEEQLYEAFREQVTALERGGADVCLIETQSDLAEARLAIRAAREHTRMEVACTFTFEPTAAGNFRTMMGLTPTDAARGAAEAGAHLIGTNCGTGFAGMIAVVRDLRAAVANLPIVVHANAGRPQLQDGQTVFPESPEFVAARVPDLVRTGAAVVGGCCGTTPAHIAAIAEAVRKLAR